MNDVALFLNVYCGLVLLSVFFFNKGSICCENGKTGNKQRNGGNFVVGFFKY